MTVGVLQPECTQQVFFLNVFKVNKRECLGLPHLGGSGKLVRDGSLLNFNREVVLVLDVFFRLVDEKRVISSKFVKIRTYLYEEFLQFILCNAGSLPELQ